MSAEKSGFRTLVKRLLPKSLFRRVEPYGHWLETVLQQIRYGFPARDLKVIGVTGTNGKTTTVFMIQRMLHEAGYKAGLMTTVAYGVGDNIKPQTTHMTTASPGLLLGQIKALKQQGMEWLVLETTSHALAQNRVWGIPYSVAVLTNVTHEHLDYHGTFEKYLAAKVKLFKLCDANKTGLRTGVINADDSSHQVFAEAIKNPLSYGLENGQLRPKNLQLTSKGSQFEAVFTTPENQHDNYKINCQIPGSFNVQNALAAVAVGRVLGLDKTKIEQGIAALKTVDGRMTRIDEGQAFDVIVDFAHTPDSFDKVFKDFKTAVRGKMLVMFGSPGHRDEAKRAIQGKLAGQYADEVIITEDDSRDVDTNEIMAEIAGGAESAGKIKNQNLFLIADRREAMEFTFKRAQPGDTVLLLGKGHEKTIYRGDHQDPWNDEASAREILRNSKNSRKTAN